MTALVYRTEKDLEKYAHTYGGEEDIHLLDDRFAGKFIYFFSKWLFAGWWIWNFFFLLLGLALSLSSRAFYLGLKDLYFYPEEQVYDQIPFTWMIVHCSLCFCLSFFGDILCIESIYIEKKVLVKLLEEIANADIVGDPAVWRLIAFRINKTFRQMGYHYVLFYSGDHLMEFVMGDIVKPLESQSSGIESYYRGERCSDFCEDPSNKILLERVLANYHKSTEAFGEFSHAKGEGRDNNAPIVKFLCFIITSISILATIELVATFIMIFATFILGSIIFISNWPCHL